MEISFGGKKEKKPGQPGQKGKEQPKKKGGMDFFGSKPKGPQIDVEGMNNQLNNISMRLRILEESYTNIRKKAQVIEQNMLSNNKHFKDEFKLMESDITDFKRKINELNRKANQIILELRTTATQEDLDVLRKYVEMWQPVNFVTMNQAERMIDELREELKRR